MASNKSSVKPKSGMYFVSSKSLLRVVKQNPAIPGDWFCEPVFAKTGLWSYDPQDIINKHVVFTRADREALKKMPDLWFEPRELPSIVKNPWFRCERLERFGLLFTQVVGEYPNLKRMYKKQGKIDIEQL